MDTTKGIVEFGANRVWRTYPGGRVLDEIEGKADPSDTHFPEDWIGSVVEARNADREVPGEGLSYVAGSSEAPIAFRDLLDSDPDYYLGQSESGPVAKDSLPLVKFLDSATRLHFQAHPTAEFAQERLGSPRGKTEAYVILAIREDVKNPYIYAGFQRPPSRSDLKNWILDQDIESIESCFTPIAVKLGDVFLIPGGRPHALGEGILMLEIMEASDLAVRFEFERCGYMIPEEARFMGRDIETALDVFNFEAVGDDQIDQVFRCQPKVLEKDVMGGRVEELIGYDQTPCFAIQRTVIVGDRTKESSQGFIGVVTEGEGSVRIEGVNTELKLWSRFYFPAGAGSLTYLSEEGMTVVECYAGKAKV